jgi:hypothetical protein
MNEPFNPQSFIESSPWIEARSGDHEYVLSRQVSREDFEELVRLIRRDGYQEAFAGREYTYLEMETAHGRHRYWSMGAAIPETILINRARVRERQAERQPEQLRLPDPKED